MFNDDETGRVYYAKNIQINATATFYTMYLIEGTFESANGIGCVYELSFFYHPLCDRFFSDYSNYETPIRFYAAVGLPSEMRFMCCVRVRSH